MDKKDEIKEEVRFNDGINYQKETSIRISQKESENKENVLQKITQTDIENKVNALRNKSQADFENKNNKDNSDNCLRKDSQTDIDIKNIKNNKENNDNSDKDLGKKSQIGNGFNALRNNSQAIDNDNTLRKLEKKDKDNNLRKLPQTNVTKKDVASRIIETNINFKSNVKPFNKKQEIKPVVNPKIKTINKKQDFKKPDYWGHRDRLRNRFRAGLLEGFTDYEVLELLLFYTINKIDTKPIAYKLINEFGSIEKVFTASYERILSVIQQDIRPSRQECEKSAFLIKFIRQLAVLLWKRGTNSKLKENEDKITSGAQLLEYLRENYNNYLEADMRDLSHEQFRVIFLDSKNKIIKDEVMFEGTINQTGVYPRQILKRALEVNATAIIAVHNHPAGTLKPSNADISVTRSLQTACDSLGISLLDHLIIGDKFCNGKDQEKSFYSFAENGLL